MFLSARRRLRPMRTAFVAILSALVVTAALGITVSAADPNPCAAKTVPPAFRESAEDDL